MGIKFPIFHGGLLDILVRPIYQSIGIVNAPPTQWSDNEVKEKAYERVGLAEDDTEVVVMYHQ